MDAPKASASWPWALAGVLFLISGGAYVAYKARGLRNNNPGNLKKGSEDWQGLDPVQSDPVFLRFVTPFFGLRALARVLVNYQRKYKLNTVQAIINRWAPPVENDTNDYVQSVAARLGVTPLQPINLTSNTAQLAAMVKAITTHENGLNPYSDDLVKEAVASALA